MKGGREAAGACGSPHFRDYSKAQRIAGLVSDALCLQDLVDAQAHAPSSEHDLSVALESTLRELLVNKPTLPRFMELLRERQIFPLLNMDNNGVIRGVSFKVAHKLIKGSKIKLPWSKLRPLLDYLPDRDLPDLLCFKQNSVQKGITPLEPSHEAVLADLVHTRNHPEGPRDPSWDRSRIIQPGRDLVPGDDDLLGEGSRSALVKSSGGSDTPPGPKASPDPIASFRGKSRDLCSRAIPRLPSGMGTSMDHAPATSHSYRCLGDPCPNLGKPWIHPRSHSVPEFWRTGLACDIWKSERFVGSHTDGGLRAGWRIYPDEYSPVPPSQHRDTRRTGSTSRSTPTSSAFRIKAGTPFPTGVQSIPQRDSGGLMEVAQRSRIRLEVPLPGSLSHTGPRILGESSPFGGNLQRGLLETNHWRGLRAWSCPRK